MYREWSRAFYHSHVFVPESKIQQLVKNAPDPGYASVYRFKTKPANATGLDQFDVYADCITLDLDGGERELIQAERLLTDAGYAYEVWSSGGKGYHVLIPHKGVWSRDLPYSHLHWVLAHKLPYDETLYQHGRLLALPGRRHPKTGKRKSFLKKVNGTPCVLDIVPTPEKQNITTGIVDGDALNQAAVRFASLVVNGPSDSRHMTIWKMARDFRKAGIGFDAIVDLMTVVNETWKNPKSEKEVIKAVKGAFK